MADRSYAPPFLAVTFVIREGLFALEQRGHAHLLPWLQRYTRPSSAPGLPEWCLGVLNVRGTVQMVVDLGGMLGYGPTEPGMESRLIFIEHGSAQLGLLVDQEIGVRSLLPIDSPAQDAVPFRLGHALLEDRPVIVLDGAALVAHVAASLHAPSYLA